MIDFHEFADHLPTLCWAANPDGYIVWYNKRWYEYTGSTLSEMQGWGWQSVHDPNKLPEVLAKWRDCIVTAKPFEMVVPLRAADGTFSPFLTRVTPRLDHTGKVTAWYGVNTDISDQIKAEEERALISIELRHRIKNIFAVISGLISLAAKNHPEAKTFTDEIRHRITALGRSHDFIRPQAHGRKSQLFGLIEELLRPYQNDKRILLLGDDVVVEERSATPLALFLHELATNAAKYGALSVPGGRITITSSLAARSLEIVWREEFGPPVVEPEKTGFGSQLATLSIEGQMGGSLSYDWRAEGLMVKCLVPLSSVCKSFEESAQSEDFQQAG